MPYPNKNSRCLFLVVMSILLMLTGCASDAAKPATPPEKPVLLGATNNGIDDVNPNRLPQVSQGISPTEGTLLGAGAGSVGGALTGNLWLIPVGAAIGGLTGLGLTLFMSDDYALQTDCFGRSTCSPVGAFQPQSKLARIINNYGGTFIDHGNDKVIIIPSRYIFMPNTAEIRQGHVDLLTMVANVAEQSQGRYIVVMAHMANIGDPADQLALTKAQANTVANYLKRYWTLRERPIVPIALGSQYPIATNNNTPGRAKNNAIIISIGRGDRLDYYNRFVISSDQYGEAANLGNTYRNGVLPLQSLYRASN